MSGGGELTSVERDLVRSSGLLALSCISMSINAFQTSRDLTVRSGVQSVLAACVTGLGRLRLSRKNMSVDAVRLPAAMVESCVVPERTSIIAMQGRWIALLAVFRWIKRQPVTSRLEGHGSCRSSFPALRNVDGAILVERYVMLACVQHGTVQHPACTHARHDLLASPPT